MKYLLILLLLPSFAQAKCHVTSDLDQQGNMLIQCTKGFVPSTRLGDAPLDDTGKVLKRGEFLSPSVIQVEDMENRILTISREEICSLEIEAVGEFQDDDADPNTPDVFIETTPQVDACATQMLDTNFCPAGDDKLNGYRLAPVPMPEGDSLANYDNTTWCVNTAIGTKDKTIYIFDAAKKQAAIDAVNAQKAAEQAAKDAEAPFLAIEKKMACGRRVIAMFAVGNAMKTPPLSRGQKIAQKNGMRDAMEFLLLGSLQEAKEEIELIVPDGVVTTEADKSAALAKITSCL